MVLTHDKKEFEASTSFLLGQMSQAQKVRAENTCLTKEKNNVNKPNDAKLVIFSLCYH